MLKKSSNLPFFDSREPVHKLLNAGCTRQRCADEALSNPFSEVSVVMALRAPPERD